MTPSLPEVLFNRNWSVEIGVAGKPGLLYTGLKTNFSIDKNSVGSSNKAKIDVTNFTAISRERYQQAEVGNLRASFQLTLKVGYQKTLRNLYIGNIRAVDSKRVSGSNIVTSFECGEAEKQIYLAILDKAYPPGTRVVNIIQDLAAAMSVDIGVMVGVRNESFNSGVTINGPVKNSLDKICSKQGLEWSIQNGAIQIKPVGSHNGQPVIILSNQPVPGITGLIGVPSQVQGITKFNALLNPNIVPGCAVRIYSETIHGDFFQIRRALFEGDSHGPKWGVSCEAFPVSAAFTLPANVGDQIKVIA